MRRLIKAPHTHLLRFQDVYCYEGRKPADSTHYGQSIMTNVLWSSKLSALSSTPQSLVPVALPRELAGWSAESTTNAKSANVLYYALRFFISIALLSSNVHAMPSAMLRRLAALESRNVLSKTSARQFLHQACRVRLQYTFSIHVKQLVAPELID